MAGDTSGQHNPYYYESFVGLTEVVKLLDPESNVASVAFQAERITKWDDVVVRLNAGGMRCYQVKHTRENNNINFTDLIKRDGKGRVGPRWGHPQGTLLNLKSTLIVGAPIATLVLSSSYGFNWLMRV